MGKMNVKVLEWSFVWSIVQNVLNMVLLMLLLPQHFLPHCNSMVSYSGTILTQIVLEKRPLN